MPLKAFPTHTPPENIIREFVSIAVLAVGGVMFRIFLFSVSYHLSVFVGFDISLLPGRCWVFSAEILIKLGLKSLE